MVRPCAFGYNPETASSNAFQKLPGLKPEEIHEMAIREFDQMVGQLQSAGVHVHVSRSKDNLAPDSVFPNNWISMHPGGKVLLYPMQSPNRRRERAPDLVDELRALWQITDMVDLSWYEKEGIYLEGTGSLVFDHYTRKVYAAISPRTHSFLVSEVASLLNYDPVVFRAGDGNGQEIYHTNVIMNIGKDYAVVCFDSVEEEMKQTLMELLAPDRKAVIAISLAQMADFCGNMLQVQKADGGLLTVCSRSAFMALSPVQREMLSHNNELLVVDIPVIEQAGGGSVRCMMAEIFLDPMA